MGRQRLAHARQFRVKGDVMRYGCIVLSIFCVSCYGMPVDGLFEEPDAAQELDAWRLPRPFIEREAGTVESDRDTAMDASEESPMVDAAEGEVRSDSSVADAAAPDSYVDAQDTREACKVMPGTSAPCGGGSSGTCCTRDGPTSSTTPCCSGKWVEETCMCVPVPR